MNYTENEVIGERLRKARTDVGKSCADVAAALGISEGHYRKIERGIYGIDLRKLFILEKVVGMDTRYLLYGESVENDRVYYPIDAERKGNSYVCQLLSYCQKQLEAQDRLREEEDNGKRV